jgi:uncharacterized protein (DUF697 family)
MFKNKKQQNSELVLLPTAPTDIDAVRTRCLALVRRRAALSAGVAAVPLPGIDVVADLASFASMIEDINGAFGLTPEQIDRLQPRMRIAAYEAVGTLGGMLVGKLVTKELVLKVLQKMGARLAAKSMAKVVPLAGQIASAAIGFALFRKMGNQHVEACVRVVREVAVKLDEA